MTAVDKGIGPVAARVDGISKRFGNHVAVDDVSFTVPTGSIYGILGPNGAGKSTTLRMLNDIIAPDQGTIELLGGLRPGRESAPHIGFLPEERGLYPKMRVLEMVAFMGELRGLTRRDATARGKVWLDRLGLAAWHGNKVQDLSKGMQQKVQFAAALIHEPELVILDEPWSGLDPINADVLREVVRAQAAAGHTVLFSTHLMEQAEQICEHVCIITRGKKVLDGRLADVKRDAAAHGRVALGFATAADAGRAAPVLADRGLCQDVEADDVVGGPDGGPALAVHVTLADGVASQRLLRALVDAGVELRRFERVVPSLHEIFVERVGRHEAEVAARREERGVIAARKRAGRPDWLVIARREFIERVRTPWFVVVTLLGPILMIGMMVLPVFLATSLDDRATVQIVDHSGKLGAPIADALHGLHWTAEVVPTDTSEPTLLGRIADGKIEGFLTIPADGLKLGAKLDYQGDNATSQKAMITLYTAVTMAVQTVRALDAGLPPAKLAGVLGPVNLESRHTTGEKPGTSGQALLIISYAVLIVLYMAIVLYASNVMRSVVQEKTNRVVEIMAAAAKPRALMVGKILGVGSVGLLQLGLWVAMAVTTMTYRSTILGAFGVEAGDWSVPPMQAADVAVILAYFLLGYFLYASLFASIGAMVSSDQEAQQAQTPVVMLLVIPMASMSVVSSSPRGLAAEIFTLIPLSSPVLMPMRWMLGGASVASLLLSLALLALTTALVAVLAGRIYRTGILMLGKRPSLGELWRWLRYPG